jgi:hypothetical protein
MTPTLLDIADDIAALSSLLDSEETTNEEAAAAIDKWLAENRDNQREKINSYIRLIRRAELDASLCKAEMDRLAIRKRVKERLVDNLAERLEFFMRTTGQRRIDTEFYCISIQANGGVQPLILEVAPENLPEKYQLTAVFGNKDLIRRDLTNGIPIDGCRLGERGESLRIR